MRAPAARRTFDPPADTLREPLFDTHTTTDWTERAGDELRQTDRSAFVARGQCQVFYCRRRHADGSNEYHLMGECATLTRIQAPAGRPRREGFRQNGVAPRRVDPTSPGHRPCTSFLGNSNT